MKISELIRRANTEYIELTTCIMYEEFADNAQKQYDRIMNSFDEYSNTISYIYYKLCEYEIRDKCKAFHKFYRSIVKDECSCSKIAKIFI